MPELNASLATFKWGGEGRGGRGREGKGREGKGRKGKGRGGEGREGGREYNIYFAILHHPAIVSLHGMPHRLFI